ncbi:MAG: ABC transporter transmembrane domain-containing protein, partial [Pseudonocardia sp.]
MHDRAAAAPTGWIRRLVRACLRHKRVMAGALLAAVAGVGSDAVAPLLVRVVVDDAVAGSTQALGTVAAALVALGLLRFGTAFVRRYLGGRLALDVQHDLRRQVFAAVQRLDGPRQDALRTGQVVS